MATTAMWRAENEKKPTPTIRYPVNEITATETDESVNSASSGVSVSINQEAIDSGQNYIATEINW